MNNMTPVDIVKNASSFRLYLRQNIYPNCQQLVQDNIYNTIPDIIDINPQYDILGYSVKCINKKSSPFDYNANVEDAIVRTLRITFPDYMYKDSNIDSNTKFNYTIIYKNIINSVHTSLYLKLLYNVYFFQSTVNSRIVSIML